MSAPVVKPRMADCSFCQGFRLVARVFSAGHPRHQYDVCRPCAKAIVSTWAQAERTFPETIVKELDP